MHRDATSSLPGIVKKITPRMIPGDAEKVEISIQSGDDPSQRTRIANTLIDALAEAVALKKGAAVHFVNRPKPKDAN